jgi:hypothetical protein
LSAPPRSPIWLRHTNLDILTDNIANDSLSDRYAHDAFHHIHSRILIVEMGDADITTSQWRLVEVGRVVVFSGGQYDGRLATVVEIIDHKRV